ncbi:lanthionine synthetase C family protein [Bradyrhizobium sp. 200]|uniref:lanthionine synthetase C family protein n=1 Tax=Bradyrhizobium sp. 200 TaxID=2782665 RepID=UPI001FFEEA0C|nr:lanthionine synthetase C family protein [Bradyrhizobium sp. 200]UPJ53442.1 lanthionine synthetase C family protein [Bradyrhizobium sp. 200]
MQIARDVANRLRDRSIVERATALAPRQSAYPETIRWHPSSLGQGDAGIAVTCGYLDACFPEEGWDRIGHGYLSRAADGAERAAQLPPGMFGGLAGFGFAGLSLSRGDTRYRRLLASVDDMLLPQLAAQASRLRRQGADGLSFAEFDAISGASGTGAYLLSRRDQTGALESLLEGLIALTGETGGRPRWWTPAALMGNSETSKRYPHGNLNCGLAHGIPGVIALMALARHNRVTVPRLDEALERIVVWLVTHRANDAWGVNWPYAIPLAESGLPEPIGSEAPPGRAAWCYGAPGVARALWLAGTALGCQEWCDLAIEAMEAVYRRPHQVRAIDSPTFCHGQAGLLQITLRFYHDTRRSEFAEAASNLVTSILSANEPDSLLGYRSWEPGGGRVDQAGLLDGAPGVLLTLLAASSHVEPTWDRAFLLS